MSLCESWRDRRREIRRERRQRPALWRMTPLTTMIINTFCSFMTSTLFRMSKKPGPKDTPITPHPQNPTNSSFNKPRCSQPHVRQHSALEKVPTAVSFISNTSDHNGSLTLGRSSFFLDAVGHRVTQHLLSFFKLSLKGSEGVVWYSRNFQVLLIYSHSLRSIVYCPRHDFLNHIVETSAISWILPLPYLDASAQR